MATKRRKPARKTTKRKSTRRMPPRHKSGPKKGQFMKRH
jgi:hypothetical protein